MPILICEVYNNKCDPKRLTALTAGGSREADMATPTRDPVLPPNTERATPAPDGSAIATPTPSPRVKPLQPKMLILVQATKSKIRVSYTAELDFALVSIFPVM